MVEGSKRAGINAVKLTLGNAGHMLATWRKQPMLQVAVRLKTNDGAEAAPRIPEPDLDWKRVVFRSSAQLSAEGAVLESPYGSKQSYLMRESPPGEVDQSLTICRRNRSLIRDLHRTVTRCQINQSSFFLRRLSPLERSYLQAANVFY
jgi:hypothetical protein